MRRQWLLIVSGARTEVLAKCPSERIKFESLGWAILITSGMATVSMWFALYSALGAPAAVALPIALLWGLVIMGIDRWLITSLPIEGKRRFSMAAPRLVLAVLLGTLISTPLVLRIFESEINAQISIIKANAASNFIQAQQKDQIGKQVTQWQATVTSLEKVIDSGGVATIDPANDPEVRSLTTQQATAYKHEQTYYKEWNCQLYGGPGCPKGAGTLYTAAHSQWLQAQAQYNQLTTEIHQRESTLQDGSVAAEQGRLAQAKGALPNAQQQLTTAQDRLNALQAKFDATNEQENGLLIRLQALSQLSNGDFTVAAARILLFLLFLVIECLPVTVKLLQQPGNYEKILQVLREKELAEAKRTLRSQSQGAPAAADRASNTDDDVRRIWEQHAEQRTKGLFVEEDTGADPGVHEPRGPRPEADARHSASRDTGEQPTVAHEDLERMRDPRVSANSDGHSGGIPLQWPDDL